MKYIPAQSVVRSSTDRPAELFDRLVRVQILLWNAVDARLRNDHDLPLTWLEPMRVVARLDHPRVHDIADALLITEGGASKLVDRIQAAGYLHRQQHPHDRRSSQIVLTPAGEQILTAAETTLDAEVADRIGAVLTDDVLARFDATLELLHVANLNTDRRPA
ncbi:MarR family winged helix-turn-helix transcriptional regulator [Nocardia sp. A7]|uniref:MarR family winged helix-turn-helix transcriptional regulator n=1 Tax=Nocardia sp. A7 TaxID=2789274 RepID=UPI003978A67E